MHEITKTSDLKTFDIFIFLEHHRNVPKRHNVYLANGLFYDYSLNRVVNFVGLFDTVIVIGEMITFIPPEIDMSLEDYENNS